MFFTVHISESKELLEQERVFEYPLDGFDEVRLQGGGVLPAWVLGIQERLESSVCLGCKIQMKPLDQSKIITAALRKSLFQV